MSCIPAPLESRLQEYSRVIFLPSKNCSRFPLNKDIREGKKNIQQSTVLLTAVMYLVEISGSDEATRETQEEPEAAANMYCFNKKSFEKIKE